MPKENYLAHYKSPNIVIIPTTSLCYPPSPKRPKVEIPLQNLSPQHADLSFLDDFNIDEIVECLNNCDSNDTTIQELTDDNDVNETSHQYSEQDFVSVTKENKTNIYNNDQKPEISDLDSQNAQEFAIDTNLERNELQDKMINSLHAENYNVTEGDTVASVECNSQSDLVEEKIISEQSSCLLSNYEQLDCSEAEIIEKDKIVCTAEELNHLQNVADNHHIVEKYTNGNCIVTKEVVDNKPTISVVNKNETEKNNSNCIHSETNNIKKAEEKIENETIKHKDIIENQLYKKNNNNKAAAAPKSTIQCKIDITISKKLEARMFSYLHTKYSVESVVHYGKFSKIFKCKDSAGKQYAVKMLNKQSDRLCLGLKKEKMFMDIQADIPKENLFCIYCANGFSLNGYWCFLMEFYPKNLKQAIRESNKPFHIDMVQDLARQLVAAVTVLRNNKIVHSDIKSSHILLNTSKTILKLCGFDRSYYIYDAKILPNIGSMNYRPPEVILGYSADYSIDVWSTALVLHEMATCHQLFFGYDNWHVLYKQISTLGSIPSEMLRGSCYKNKYFVGGKFKKRLGAKGKKFILMHRFSKNNRLSRTVYGAYYSHWAPLRTKEQKTNDFKKIDLFLKLLEQMLVTCPNYRISIEFVCANPFIYEMFD